jgi:hypothetical protein
MKHGFDSRTDYHEKIKYIVLWCNGSTSRFGREDLSSNLGGTTSMPCKFGELAEWSIAVVLKTIELKGSGSSNLSLSAKVSLFFGKIEWS